MHSPNVNTMQRSRVADRVLKNMMRNLKPEFENSSTKEKHTCRTEKKSNL